MNIVITDKVHTDTAIIGVGVVNPGDVVDVPEELAQNLINEGRASVVPPSPTPKKNPAPVVVPEPVVAPEQQVAPVAPKETV